MIDLFIIIRGINYGDFILSSIQLGNKSYFRMFPEDIVEGICYGSRKFILLRQLLLPLIITIILLQN